MNSLKNRTAVELLIGNILYFIICEIVILLICPEKVFTSLGLLVGVTLSCFMLFSIQKSVEISVALGETEALKHTRKSYIFRMITVIIIVLLLCFTQWVNTIAMLFGLLALKLSAYLQPFTSKLVDKFTKHKGR